MNGGDHTRWRRALMVVGAFTLIAGAAVAVGVGVVAPSDPAPVAREIPSPGTDVSAEDYAPLVRGRRIHLGADVQATADRLAGAFQRCLAEHDVAGVPTSLNPGDAPVIVTYTPDDAARAACEPALRANERYEVSTEYQLARRAQAALTRRIEGCLSQADVGMDSASAAQFDACVAASRRTSVSAGP